MMNHSTREIRIRRMRRLRDAFLEKVAYIVVFGIAAYLFVWMPLARSMGW